MLEKSFQLHTDAGCYEFAYDTSSRLLFFVRWPNGNKAKWVLGAQLPNTIEKAIVAAQSYLSYIEPHYKTSNDNNASI